MSSEARSHGRRRSVRSFCSVVEARLVRPRSPPHALTGGVEFDYQTPNLIALPGGISDDDAGRRWRKDSEVKDISAHTPSLATGIHAVSLNFASEEDKRVHRRVQDGLSTTSSPVVVLVGSPCVNTQALV